MTQQAMIGHFRIIRNRAANAEALSSSTSSTLLCTNETTSTGSRGGESYSPPDTNQGTRGTRLDQSRNLRAQNMSNNISQKQYFHGQKPEENVETATSNESWNSLMRYQTSKIRGRKDSSLWSDKAALKRVKPDGNLRLVRNEDTLISSGDELLGRQQYDRHGTVGSCRVE